MADGENNTGTDDGAEDKGKDTFEGEFDENRAKRLIQNLRDEISSLKEERTSLREQAGKVEGLEERLAAAETGTKEARRALHVARAQAKHGLSDEEAEEFLSGLDDEEKILARAERLAGLRAPASQEGAGDGDGDGGDDDGDEDGLGGKPKPNLRPGSGGGDDSGEIDEDALLAAARERRGY